MSEHMRAVTEPAQPVVSQRERVSTKKAPFLSKIPGLRIFVTPEGTLSAGGTTEELGEWAPWDNPGSTLRSNARWASKGFYAPSFEGGPSTTRQADILNTALIAAPTGVEGVTAGRDVLSQTPICKDPVTDYNAEPRRVTSTNVLVVGDVGAGKSSFTKTVYCLRPAILKQRRCVIFDKKNENGEGEYSEVVRFFSTPGSPSEPIRFTLDGSGARINILDPAIAGSNDVGMNNQLLFLQTIPALLREGRGPDEWERKALRLAYRALRTDFEGGRAPTTADLHDRLGIIDPADHTLLGSSPDVLERLHAAGMAMRWCFNELLETFGGMFDGETSNDVRLNARVTSMDISQLPDHGAGIPLVMGIGNLWLLARVRRDRGFRTNVINEEAGHILGGPLAVQQRSNIKLSRGLGISNIYNIHKGRTDVPADSPGMAVIEEAQTVHIFRHTRPLEAQWCVQTFDLNPDTALDITRLKNGHHILKSGVDTPENEIEHIRSTWEMAMTDTDGAISESDGLALAN